MNPGGVVINGHHSSSQPASGQKDIDFVIVLSSHVFPGTVRDVSVFIPAQFDGSNNRLHRIDLDGIVSEFVGDAGQAHCVTVGADGTMFTISERSGKLMSYDASGKGKVMMEDILGHSILARPDGSLYVTTNGDKAHGPGSVWLIKDGKKLRADDGLKFATGMTCRPDQWLLSVAEGHSKWVCSYQINEDGTLTDKDRFFHLHDAGAESLGYSVEGRQFVATRSGVQISADDGPAQVILPVPDFSRVTGVCLGGKDGDTLFAFCGNRVWKRRIQHHAMGAFTPWTNVNGTKLRGAFEDLVSSFAPRQARFGHLFLEQTVISRTNLRQNRDRHPR